MVRAYVDSLDLGSLYAKIQVVEGKAGRDAVDPKILMALWMLVTIEGVSSARQLDRLCAFCLTASLRRAPIVSVEHVAGLW